VFNTIYISKSIVGEKY